MDGGTCKKNYRGVDERLVLLGPLDSQIVGDSALHHRRTGACQHVGAVRVVVAPT